MKALVLYCRKYEFTDRTTGELVKGNSASYMEIMEPMSDESEKGLPPMSVLVSDECLPLVLASTLPAVCDVDFGRRPGRKGKPETVMTAFKAGRPWSLGDILGAAAVAPK